MKFQVGMFAVSELVISTLTQFDILPTEFSSVLIQLPIVGLFAWYVLHSNKQNREWLDRLMETQDQRHQRTVELFEKIFDRIDIRQNQLSDRVDVRQNQLSDRIELLTQQLAVNSSAINEAMRLAELAEELKKLVDNKE